MTQLQKTSSVAKFKPSKWETVDPEVVEAQGNSFWRDPTPTWFQNLGLFFLSLSFFSKRTSIGVSKRFFVKKSSKIDSKETGLCCNKHNML